MNQTAAAPAQGSGRFVSLDVMRGIIMILLCGESCRLYSAIKHIDPEQPMEGIINQFFHHSWNGLHFWDLVQPAFMFMAGTALYISYSRKLAKGETWRSNLPHILSRCLKLFICGVALHCVYADKLVWELWNVLTQLAFTSLMAYLIINWSSKWQMLFTIGLLLLTEGLYRGTHVPGFDQAFVKGANFGAYIDSLVMGKINGGGWVFINFIPTAAHTIWGVLAGKLLLADKPAAYKIKTLITYGFIALILGFGLDILGITPIIKRISSSSFVLASMGWVLLILAAVYALVDVLKYQRYAWIFTVVGMNAIFIYLLFETVGAQWLNKKVGIFTGDMLHTYLTVPIGPTALVTAIATLLLEWGLCYWLYKRKIFFKL